MTMLAAGVVGEAVAIDPTRVVVPPNISDATLTEWAEEVVALDADIDQYRLRRDVLKAALRSVLEARGKRSFSTGTVRVKLSPCHEVWCLCHRAPVEICSDALAGRAVHVERVECVPWTSVRRISGEGEGAE